MNKTFLKKIVGRWSFPAGLLLAGLALAGCQTSNQFSELPGYYAPEPAAAAVGTAPAPYEPAAAAAQPVANTRPEAAPSASAGSLDRIHVGDTLTISFSDVPEIMAPREERVKEDGSITLVLNQTFSAAGKTIGDLEREIRSRYVPRYYVNMTVSVKPAPQSQFYFVGGEVKIPNRQVYIGRTTVTRAIQSAGDFTDFANKRKVILIRANGKKETINCLKVLRDPSLDPEVFPGDRITVMRRLF